LLRALIALLLLSSGCAWANGEQQERMKECNARADDKALQGQERNRYMVDCLKGGANGNGRRDTVQHQRSDACNQAARERRMQGAERRGFLSACTRPPVDKRAHDCAQRAKEMKVEGEDRLRFINGCVEGTKTRT
jgi:hypothetical protein